jgi:hypothetical protein
VGIELVEDDGWGPPNHGRGSSCASGTGDGKSQNQAPSELDPPIHEEVDRLGSAAAEYTISPPKEVTTAAASTGRNAGKAPKNKRLADPRTNIESPNPLARDGIAIARSVVAMTRTPAAACGIRKNRMVAECPASLGRLAIMKRADPRSPTPPRSART